MRKSEQDFVVAGPNLPANRPLLAFIICFHLVLSATAQLVSDGATNVINHVTNNVTGDLTVGTNGSLTALVITNAAAVNVSSNAFIGRETGSLSNFVHVTGVASRWRVGRELSVGSNGWGNRLWITDGGSVTSRVAYVGRTASSSSNAVTIAGSGSVWSNAMVFYVGNDGAGNRLTLQGGGTLRNDGFAYIGQGSASSNNLAIITDGGSYWSNRSQVFVGRFGSANRIEIKNGAVVHSGTLNVGFSSGGNNNIALVTGTGSLLTNETTLDVGFQGSYNTLVVSNEAVAASSFGVIGDQLGSHDNLALVTGTGSRWLNSMNLIVGYFGTSNKLEVSHGASASTGLGLIGFAGSASNNLALVSGAGSVWAMGVDLYVGYSNSASGLVVSNGGCVTAGANLFVGFEPISSNNFVHSHGGRIIVTNGAGTGLFDLRRGTHLLENGWTTADRLVIGTKSLLRGTGAIIGSVTNFGGIAPGGSPGAMTIDGTLILQNSGNLTFEIGGPITNTDDAMLSVTGSVVLNGAFQLSLTNGFHPSANDAFTLFKFASATGSFTNVASGGRVNTTDNLGSFEVTISATNLVVGNYLSPDSDGDGMTDYEEFLAGTEPGNPGSVLKIASLQENVSGQPIMRFPYIAGKNYRILYRDDLVTGVWNVIASPDFSEPMPGFYEWVDDGSQTGGLNVGGRFYRIGLP